jgi:hypothetical protein
MEKYNYLESIVEDVKDYIKENYEKEEYENIDRDTLYDDLWVEDSVTGNASGSYYCNSYKAEESLNHNLDLLREALEEFGENDVNALEKGAEWCDVTIRCYLLGQAIDKALEDLENEGE